MKKQLKEILRKNNLKLMIEAIDLVILIYLLSCPAKYLGKIIDMLDNMEANKILIVKDVLLIVLAAIGVLIARIIFKTIEFDLECKIRKMLTDNLFNKFMKMKIEDINQIKNGEIMSYFVRDAKKIPRQLLRFYSSFIRVIANITIVIILMTQSSNIKLALCAIIPIFVTIVTLIFIRNNIKKTFKLAQQSFTEFSEYVQEDTDSIRTIKAFAGEEYEEKIFEEKNNHLRNSNLKVKYYGSLLDVVIYIGMGISYAISLLWGSNLVVKGEMTVGDIISFMGYLTLLDMPIQFVPWCVSKFDELKIAIARLNKMFNMPEEKIKLDNPKSKIIDGGIKIDNLTFHYPDGIEEVLSNISIDIKIGETLGIIGVIGSGKTTLMNLLLRLYNVPKGKIYIGGKDINDIPIEELRESICYITQDNFLFSSTLKDNINLFKDDYKDEEIEESIKKAMIFDEIKEMREGIYTIIGEKGIDLSGGQKQRVVLSRAFLNNSSIVIFDDTFSALDNKTEQHVLNNIKKLTENKTCIIVSNRITDIKDCDKIIVLENGKIIERGTHGSLLDERGSYYKFYETQAHKLEELA